ncbi:putative nuclease HARBI1 [Xyrichtys novacula]|uniref:Nuclease HARBI1 n=1 Tax=Xyrichtys novacula TaxID=13765 RepID=A0AAV1G0D3_XYRNO|nr:putative nuclease HARBI1 [Xyrichtys novacula]
MTTTKCSVICDADLIFINCVAKWPGSVHDARMLRECSLFQAFENNARKPVNGVILGDSGYMQRDWLFTPLSNPTTSAEKNDNARHMSARSTVERSIGVLKRRWHGLRRLRLAPHKACKVIVVCIMLNNRARRLNLDVPSDSDSSDSSSSEDDSDSDNEAEQQRPVQRQMTERARVAAGKVARQRFINNNF